MSNEENNTDSNQQQQQQEQQQTESIPERPPTVEYVERSDNGAHETREQK